MDFTQASEEALDKAISAALAELKYEKLLADQELVIKRFLKGHDVFVCLPTGSGKSLCYCLLPKVVDNILERHGDTSSMLLVISPLIALMKDQVRAMTRRGMSAVYASAADADDNAINKICSGSYQLIFMSPESLFGCSQWRDMLQSHTYQERLIGLAVDEAHCVKKWGDTFRKSFALIGEVRSLLPETIKIMALTATATTCTRKAVCQLLGMIRPAIVARVPNRLNIKYTVYTDETIDKAFAPLVEELRFERTKMDRVIIYCRTYDTCSSIYLCFKSKLGKELTEPIGAVNLARFRLVDMFCACTTTTVKESILKSFSCESSPLRVVVATIAFGMGLDCPNVRRVIHWGASEDIEDYVQETGRAGRDGLPAQAILYRVHLPGIATKKEMKDYCANMEHCRRQILLRHFDHEAVFQETVTKCLCCDLCAIICDCAECAKL